MSALEAGSTREVIMGKRGPVPKHSDARRRRNKGPSAKDKLYAEAQRLDIPGRSKMSKGELERAIKSHGESSSAADAGSAKMPAADPKWHRIAKRWYLSLGESGQSDFYEASDWALAQIVAESISRDLKPQVVGVNEETGQPVMAVIPMKGASLAAYLKSMTALMVSEGDRRRAGIELKRVAPESAEPEEPSNVMSMERFKARAAGGS